MNDTQGAPRCAGHLPRAECKVLVVDDTPANLNVLCALLEDEGYDLSVALNGPQALEIAAELVPDLVLLDVMMPGMDGFEVCRRLKQSPITARAPVIFVTARDLSDSVVSGFAAGGVDYITKPFREDEVLARVRTHLRLCQLHHELEQRNQELEAEIARRRQLTGQISELSAREAERWGLQGFIGESETLRRIFADIELMQENTATSVLITGESGTGKELIARAIHFGGARRHAPFVPVNCAALPRDLVESLLFGHAKGAFTGADADRAGYFEMANDGTLFLDEIAEMPVELQPKLLRVLEDGVVQRVGEHQQRQVNVRTLAATNQSLEQRLGDGSFRQDLYYRIARFTVVAPPLRERLEDIPLLAAHFVQLFAREMGREPPSLSTEVLQRLRSHAYPGNVRELKNIVERAVIESRGGPLEPRHIHLLAVPPAASRDPAGAEMADDSARHRDAAPVPMDPPASLDAAVRETETRLVQRALKTTGGNIAEAARLLRTNRNRIYRIMEEEHADA